MSITQWKAKHSIANSFRNEMDSLFNNFFNDSFFETDNHSISPKINISETQDKFEISAELPGIKEKDIDIKIANNYLTISAKNEYEKKQEDKNYICMERSYGSFQRSIKLPNNIKSDDISASFKDAILHLDIPKKEVITNDTKKIEINK